MKPTKKYYPAIFCAALIAFSVGNGMAQDSVLQEGDPARWYIEDTTPQAQLRTLKKELGAALDEARRECKRRPAAQRAPCLRDARTTYLQDMASATQLRAPASSDGAQGRAQDRAPRR